MARNLITKAEIETYVLKLKYELLHRKTKENKTLTDEYLNRVLEKLKEYRG
jgi:hypothetical protein